MKYPIRWFAALSVSLVVGNAVVGCGTDASTTGGAGASGGSGGSSGSGGSAGKAGSGGNSGSAGTAGSAGSSGSAGAGGGAGTGGSKDSGADTGGMTLQCGSKSCSPTDVTGLGTLPPCCAPGEMNACGLSYMTICFTLTPGTSNPLCPDVSLPTTTGTMVTVTGCCTATGVCGGQIGAPFGCNDLLPFTGQSGAACGGDAGQPPPPQDSGADSGPSPEAGADAADTGPRSDVSDSGSTDSSDARPADARADGG